MRLQVTIIIALCLSVGSTLPGQTRSAEAQLKAAQHKEHVEGDLKGAIEQYKQLVARRDIARDLTAQALLGLGQSYEKLGAIEARAVYERIIRDYTDQGTIVAAARARVTGLGALPSRGLVARQLLQLPSSIAVLSLLSDGRIGATDWSTGDLVVVDPSSGAISRIIEGDIEKPAGTFAEDPVLSPDRRQLAYLWFGSDPREQKGVLRVISMDKGAKPRTVVADPAAMKNVTPVGWSSDSASVLVSYEKPVPPASGRPEGQGDFDLAWISVDRGAIKPIRAFEWWRSAGQNGIGSVKVSPDGGWITYAVPDRQGAPERSIFVTRADGSAERRLVTGGVNDQPMWSPDGSRIVFLSNRSGDPGLWSVAVNPPDDKPTLIKNGTGRVLLHGMLPSGAVVYSEAGLDPLIVAELDQRPESKASPSLRTAETLNGLVPAWSRDGRHLAYKRRTTNPARSVELVVHTFDTGEVRTYSPRTGTMGVGQPTWYGDGSVQAITKSGVRLKVGGLTLEELAVPATLPMGFVSPDGRTLYATAAAVGIEVFDASSGTRTGSVPVPKDWRPAALSPDGRTFALRNLNNPAAAKLAVMGVDGADFRTLPASIDMKIIAGEAAKGLVDWTRDGSALIVAVSTGEDVSAIQRVPVAGGPAVTIAAKIRGLRAFDISPDERRIAYSIDRPTTDVWMLDLKAVMK